MSDIYQKYNIDITEELEDSNKVDWEYFELTKDISVTRGNRNIGYLEYNTHTTGNDGNLKKQRRNIQKNLKFNRNMDSYLNLTQDNKSSVSWKNTIEGLEHCLSLLVEKFRIEKVCKYLKETKDRKKLLENIEDYKSQLPNFEFNYDNITEFSDLEDIKYAINDIKDIISKLAKLNTIKELIKEGFPSDLNLDITTDNVDIQNELKRLENERNMKIEKENKERQEKLEKEKIEKEKLRNELEKAKIEVLAVTTTPPVVTTTPPVVRTEAQVIETKITSTNITPSVNRDENNKIYLREEIDVLLKSISNLLDYYKYKHPEKINNVEEIISTIESDMENM